ncbi:MAG: hypothetical protein NT031_17265 [Planctomycetota bacterium]|nr:hypothetical protein [Planctomycetota bacterium]
MPIYIELPDKSRLWLHPEQNEPLPTTDPGWSITGRRAWLEGKGAPNPAEFFQQVAEQIAWFLDMPADKAPGVVAVLALWILLTYIYPVFDAVPYLYIGGPWGSGKSRVFEILVRLVFRAVGSSNLTAACLFRTLHSQGGTLLLDEAERLKQTTPDVAEVLSILLAGYKRGGKATRLEPFGDTFRPTEFDVFGPKAVACVAGLPPALASRCISLMMFRASGGSPKPRRRIKAGPRAWQDLRDDLHALAMEHGPTWLTLPEQVEVCPTMSGRHFELWQPRLAVAGWVESAGACGLSEIVRQHAMDSIEANRDDQVSETDDVLLRVVANLVRNGGRNFTAGDILTAARESDEKLFQWWSKRTVSARLQLYGLPASRKTTNGRRVYDFSCTHLLRIQEHYGIDLEILPAETVTSHTDEPLVETFVSAPSPPFHVPSGGGGGSGGTGD